MGIFAFIGLIPPFCLIWIFLLLLAYFAFLYPISRWLGIQKEDLKGGSFAGVLFPAWGIGIASVYLSHIAMLFISAGIPVLNRAHSEWGITDDLIGNAVLYALCLSAVYCAFLSLDYLALKVTIADEKKRKNLFRWLIGFSFLLMFLAPLVLVGLF